MGTRISAGLMMLALLATDFLEFHDIFEHKTVPEYITGVISIPLMLLLAGLVIGVTRLAWSES